MLFTQGCVDELWYSYLLWRAASAYDGVALHNGLDEKDVQACYPELAPP